MNRLAEKKKLLVAESEVYRQLLKLEFQTLNVYTKRAQRRATSISTYFTYLPMFIAGVPLLRGFLGGKRRESRSPVLRLGGLLLAGWKAYRRFGPLVLGKRFSMRSKETSKTAAEEYLAKRL